MQSLKYLSLESWVNTCGLHFMDIYVILELLGMTPTRVYLNSDIAQVILDYNKPEIEHGWESVDQ